MCDFQELRNGGLDENHSLSIFAILPSGRLTVCYGKSPLFVGKSTISIAIKILWYFFTCLWKMAIEIVDLPTNNDDFP